MREGRKRGLEKRHERKWQEARRKNDENDKEWEEEATRRVYNTADK